MRRAVLAIAVLGSCVDAAAPVEQLAELDQPATVCADGPTTYGIDVSRFQGTIDWQPVADSGVKFAYIQISRSLTDLDAKFDYNWRRAKEVGILRGAYQRFRPNEDVIGQADVFLNKLGPYVPGDLPPMLDVEDTGGLSATQIAAAVKQWMDYVTPKVGLVPIIYTGFYFWRDSVASADFSQHPLWIANYSATCPLVPDHWTRWAFHQYSSTVTIPGITANTVDVDKFNGTYADLVALAAPPSPCGEIQSVTDGGHVVDDSTSCFTAGGDPQFIRHETAGYGSSLQWTHATDLAAPANFGLWNLTFAEAGRYRVEAFTPAPYNQSKKTVYQVTHAGTTTPVMVDQSAVDGWNPIGELDFAAGVDQTIRVDDNTGEPGATNTQIVFDAIRFTRLAPSDPPPPPPDDEPPADDPATGGCAVGGGAGWALALLALRLRRRRSPGHSDRMRAI